jgi:polar amino acid transport system substrate-binding protein/glutamate/aspartate transport system substrate-binding protein
LALRHGDSDFRLAVDTALSHIYRWGEITVFSSAFGPLTSPSPILANLDQTSGLPD